MPRLPRDCDYKRLISLLKKYDYTVISQKGSHIKLRSESYKHSITVPAHSPLKIGTLQAIVSDIAVRVGEDKERLIELL
jgi:predicted RNA binding protein YcfA (HicA-like mRNA interferase family)